MSNELYHEDLGSRLLVHSVRADRHVLLVAPFMKRSVVERILGSIAETVAVDFVTRWRPDEILAGASDLDVWPLLRDRGQSTLRLCNSLHAKYYRFDERCLIGSANLTAAALGWSPRPNLELLQEVDGRSDRIASFEDMLMQAAVVVTEDLYQLYEYLIDELRPLFEVAPRGEYVYDVGVAGVAETKDEVTGRPASAEWLPTLRHPEHLYAVYLAHTENLTTTARRDAEADLLELSPPQGLESSAFKIYIGLLLLQYPVVQAVDAFVRTPQRFGAVRQYLKTLPCGRQMGFNASEAWQTLMRWLLYFLPDRYTMREQTYSEVFGHRALMQS